MRPMSHSTAPANVLLLLALACLLLLLSASPHAEARELTPDLILAPTEPASPTDDGGTAEIGVEWMTDWPGTVNDRANWYYSGNDLYNKMTAAGWIGRFNWGETNAWEKDFKRAALGGIENTVGDSVDLAMVATHGSTAWDSTWSRVLTSVTFTSDKDDRDLSPGDAYRALGDNDLEWLFFDSCSVLRDDSMWYWYQTFDGLHLLGGFANTMYVVYRGDGGAFADELLKTGWWIFGHPAKTVTQAWFTATDDEQPHGVRARVLAEELDSYNDYVHGQGYVSPDYPNNGSGWFWDHVAGTPDPLPLAAEPPTHLPAVQSASRGIVDESYVKNIGLAFGLEGDVLKSPDGRFFYMAGGPGDALQLRVDIPSGGFLFQNLAELWTDPERARTLPRDPQGALNLAYSFLDLKNDYIPGAFDRNTIMTPTVTLEGPSTLLGNGASIAAAGEFTATIPLDYAIHFARAVHTPVGTFPIVGPGSRQNIYIGDGSEVAGMKGGWRGLDVAAEATIPILAEGAAWEAFLKDPTIAVADLPAFDRATQKGEAKLGYYEVPLSQHQSQLIPVWIFVADLLVDVEVPAPPGAAAPAVVQDILAADAYIYVPAADDTPVPTVTIHTPANGTILPYGGTVNLSGTATGGTGNYTYLWSSSYDGDLGTGATINNVALHALFHGGLAPNTITLTVIDDNGMTAAAHVLVYVDGALFLPYVNRD